MLLLLPDPNLLAQAERGRRPLLLPVFGLGRACQQQLLLLILPRKCAQEEEFENGVEKMWSPCSSPRYEEANGIVFSSPFGGHFHWLRSCAASLCCCFRNTRWLFSTVSNSKVAQDMRIPSSHIGAVSHRIGECFMLRQALDKGLFSPCLVCCRSSSFPPSFIAAAAIPHARLPDKALCIRDHTRLGRRSEEEEEQDGVIF